MARFDLSNYSTVAERIDKFWEKYPDGRIHTEIVHFDAQNVVMKAEIYTRIDDEMPTTIDYAEERPDTSPVNKAHLVDCPRCFGNYDWSEWRRDRLLCQYCVVEVDRGLVVDTGKRVRLSSGRYAIVWGRRD